MSATNAGLRLASGFVIAAVALMMYGCSYPALISPEPLPRGEACASLGLVGEFLDGSSYPGAHVAEQVRYGLGGGVDVGGRLILPWYSLYADVKWNILPKPFYVTADLGASYESAEENDMSEHFITDTLAFGIYPALLVGTESFYLGARLRARRDFGKRYGGNRPGWYCHPAAVIGASFGRRFRIMPSVEIGQATYGNKRFWVYVASINLQGHLQLLHQPTEVPGTR